MPGIEWVSIIQKGDINKKETEEIGEGDPEGYLKDPEGPGHVQGEEVLDPGSDCRTIAVRREKREDLPLDP